MRNRLVIKLKSTSFETDLIYVGSSCDVHINSEGKQFIHRSFEEYSFTWEHRCYFDCSVFEYYYFNF